MSEKLPENSSNGKRITQIEKLENEDGICGFREHYTILNPNFSEYDDCESYLQPVWRHIYYTLNL